MQIKHMNDFYDEKAKARQNSTGFRLLFGGIIFVMSCMGAIEIISIANNADTQSGAWLGGIIGLWLCIAVGLLAIYKGIRTWGREQSLLDAGRSAYRDQYLATLAKEQLIAVAASQEFTAEERGMATAMLNNRHSGWSLAAGDQHAN